MAATIRQYYSDNFADLGRHQLHFASRLYLWNRDIFAAAALADLKTETVGKGTVGLQSIIEGFINSPDLERELANEKINGFPARKAYMAKYPTLALTNQILFRLLLARTVFQQPTGEIQKSFLNHQDLYALEEKLLMDESALRTLSTHAINFLYLWNSEFKPGGSTLDLDYLIEAGKRGYNLEDKKELQLCIYFFTHCIIGETLFYSREISADKRPKYLEMLRYIEALIADNFILINLDNKFEFLVCCKVLGYSSRLSGQIIAEAEQSFSDSGDFLIDKFNENIYPNKNSFELSEHRNVLFIMSSTAYPHAPEMIT